MSNCVSCLGDLYRALKGSEFRSVSSDLRPLPRSAEVWVCGECGLVQRNRSEEWNNCCTDLYQSYEAYPHGGGTEQKIVESQDSALVSRSEALVKHVQQSCNPKEKHSWLDVGCGQGHLLSAVADQLPWMSLVGSDKSEEAEGYLRTIAGATFCQDIEYVRDRFDIISLVHVLEHFVDPKKELQKIREKLNDDGLLLIQVPSFERNPYDLIIYDHGTFFTKESIVRLLSSACFKVLDIGHSVSMKELTVIARRREKETKLARVTPERLNETLSTLHSSFEELAEIRRVARALVDSGKITIFGSSIGACWLFNEIGSDNVDCFCDQDRDRIGREFLGKEIRALSDVYQGRVVYPLDQQTRQKVFAQIDG